MAGERRLNWGADATDAKYRTGDDDANSRFIVAEDLDGATVLLEYDETAAEWVSRGPVNMSGNAIENISALGTSSNRVTDIYGGTGDFSEVSTGTATIDGNSALREGGKSDATPGFGTVVQISADRPSLVTVTAQAKTDGSTRALVQLAVDETGDGSGDGFKTIARQAPTGSGDTSQSTATAYLRPGEQYFVRNVDDPNNGNGLNEVDEVIL